MLWLLPALAAPVPLRFPLAERCEGRAVDVAMVGDVMQHGQQLAASRRADGTYTWRGVFDPVEAMIEGADLAIANLETPVDAEQPYGGYPLFNAPEALLDALVEAGFDILQTANNHCLDRGPDGLLATLRAIEARGLQSAGTEAEPGGFHQPWVLVTLPGPIRVAFVAHTYGTNGRPLPPDAPWMVHLLDDGRMQQVIVDAREHADIVIVGLHWGHEYRHRPASWQRDLARSLVEAGADIVMGTHPHVLQPAEVLRVELPDGPREALVLYSLGNFVSNQRTHPRDGGVIVRAVLRRCRPDRVRVADVRFTPVWVDDRVRGATGKAFRVVPVPPAGERCSNLDLSEDDCRRAEAFREHAATLLPEEQFDWRTGDVGVLAARPLPRWPTALGPIDRPVPVGSIWPLRPLLRTQADP